MDNFKSNFLLRGQGGSKSIDKFFLSFLKTWLCCKCFFVDVIFALTAWTLSGNHLHTNWCKTLKIDVFIQNENKCTNRQKKTILSKLHQSRCSLTTTAKFLMSTKVFLNSCHVLQNNIILGKLYSMCFVSPLIYFVKGN